MIGESKLADNSPRFRVVNTLKEEIDKGRLPRGSHIPSERKLADQLGVARGTVRTALVQLEQEGVIGLKDGRRQVIKTPGGNGIMAHTLAVMTTNPHELDLSEEHASVWLRFIEVGAMEYIPSIGYHAMALYTDRLASEGIDHLVMNPPRGLVITERARDTKVGRETMNALAETEANVVVYGNAPGTRHFDRVNSDHRNGSRKLTEYLIQQGCRRILRVWFYKGDPRYWLQERDAGYEDAMHAVGLPPLPALHISSAHAPNSEKSEHEARTLAGYLIEYMTGPEAVDAILVMTDAQVYSVAKAVTLFGRQPNRDILIGGYDALSLEAGGRDKHLKVPVATVDKQNRKIGAEMVKLVVKRADGGLASEPRLVQVEPRLVIPGKSV